jgi:hypothetical protein
MGSSENLAGEEWDLGKGWAEEEEWEDGFVDWEDEGDADWWAGADQHLEPEDWAEAEAAAHNDF